jgi:hypothetical protein
MIFICPIFPQIMATKSVKSLSHLAISHGYTYKGGVDKYCKLTIDICGDLLDMAGIDLMAWKYKKLPPKLILFLRKINPSEEDLQDEFLMNFKLSNIFPTKFTDENNQIVSQKRVEEISISETLINQVDFDRKVSAIVPQRLASELEE